MKKGLIVILAMMFVVLGGAKEGRSNLIGDEVYLTHYHPDLSSVFQEYTTDVEEGLGDSVTFFNVGYSVNIEASEVYIHSLNPQSMHWGSASFNGLVVSDIDYDDGFDLTGVSISTNLDGWSQSRLSYESDLVRFNWQDLTFNYNTYFNAYLSFQATPIPEPATMLLFGTGLAGFAGARFRRKKKTS